MFGLRFIKTQPNQYVIQFRNGRPHRQGAGLSMLYFAPTSSLVVVPTASVNEPFIFEEVTADFQDITIQGQVIYRIADPQRTATLLNFALDAKGRYASEDPEKLSQRVIDQVQVAMRGRLQSMPMNDALASGEALVAQVSETLRFWRSSPNRRRRERLRRKRERRCCAAPTRPPIRGAMPPSNRSAPSRKTSSTPRSRSRTRNARSRRRRWRLIARCASAAARSSRRK